MPRRFSKPVKKVSMVPTFQGDWVRSATWRVRSLVCEAMRADMVEKACVNRPISSPERSSKVSGYCPSAKSRVALSAKPGQAPHHGAFDNIGRHHQHTDQGSDQDQNSHRQPRARHPDGGTGGGDDKPAHLGYPGQAHQLGLAINGQQQRSHPLGNQPRLASRLSLPRLRVQALARRSSSVLRTSLVSPCARRHSQ